MTDADRPHDELLADLVDAILNVERELHHRHRGEPDVIPLNDTERLVMRYVDRHPGAPAGVVADGTRLLRSNLSHALRGLEAKGLVVRTPDPDDARSSRLHPTPLAATNLARLRHVWAGAVAGALPPGSDDDVAAAVRLLEGVATSLAARRAEAG
ncbi:MarR family winged helix-turn-helix transcriptional regulator [Isoptericola sp. F-RaC21]|uniref:MarR family winged helix-turn-helix transcriptional regulator n=1 Tax=Isoptericola sp. F-RaC21 TaxID=3141452 RepID=UPI00315C2CDD